MAWHSYELDREAQKLVMKYKDKEDLIEMFLSNNSNIRELAQKRLKELENG